LKRPEVKIVIPDILKLQLVDDWENVTKNNQVRCSLLNRRKKTDGTLSAGHRSPFTDSQGVVRRVQTICNRYQEITRSTCVSRSVSSGLSSAHTCLVEQLLSSQRSYPESHSTLIKP